MHAIKTAFCLLVLTLCALLLVESVRGAPGDAATRTTFGLQWDASPAAEEVTAYRVYSQTNVAGTNWTVLATVTGGASTNWTFVVTSLPGWSAGYRGPHFFTLTASNMWGESSFSEVAWIPAPPSSDRVLRISAAR